MAAVWPPGPADLGSLLCNARKLSCLILILTTSQPSVLTALKPVGAVYENIFSPIVSLEEYALEPGYCKSHSAVLGTAKSLRTEYPVSRHSQLPSVLQNMSAISVVDNLFLPCLFLSPFLSHVYIPLVPCDYMELCHPVVRSPTFPSSFWNIDLINTDALLQTSD